MIVLKYKKIDSARFVSHIDILRHFVRIIRRADFKVDFSQGFNPHMLIYFSPPLSLGLSSECEYVSIQTKDNAKEVFEKYCKSCPTSLEAIDFFEVEKDLKLQANIVSADYVFPVEFDKVKIDKDYVLTFERKGEMISEKVWDKTYSIWNENGKLAIRVANGQRNLRVDRLATQLEKDFGVEIPITKICKTAQFVEIDGKFQNVDEFLKIKEKEWFETR